MSYRTAGKPIAKPFFYLIGFFKGLEIYYRWFFGTGAFLNQTDPSLHIKFILTSYA